MVLVAGATGMVGSAVCEKLLLRGEQVRALVRSTSSSEKTAALRACGAELFVGDLKEPESITAACRGIDAIITTASSTLSRQPGDSIASVDDAGILNLVRTARAGNIERFVFVSFRRDPAFPFPLSDAKEAAEEALQTLNFTIVQASWFMEVWLSPALGFDYSNGTARIYGSGRAPISWVSFLDVAEVCTLALRHPADARTTIEFGGPEALSPLEVVARFERVAGRPFRVEHVPETVLRAQFDQATDPMQKSFAALMLRYASGDAMEMDSIAERFALRLTSIDDYAHRVLARPAAH